MSLSTSTIVGRLAFPDNTPLAGGVIEFALSSFDTQGVNLVPGLSDARFTLDADGNIPAGSQLWRNTAGIRGTRYTVSVRSPDYACPYHAFTLGEIEVGPSPSYNLGDLLREASDGLTPYYGVGAGKIAIHYATDSVVVNPSGAVTLFQNKGGAGSVFNAPVVGQAMTISRNAVISSQTTGYGLISTPAEMIGVHLLMVISPNQFTGSNQILGSPSSVIRQANGAGGWRLNVWHNPGTGGVTFSSTIFNPNVEGFVLCEISLTPTQVSFFINGTAGGTFNHPYLAFIVDRLASGGTGGDRFKGLVGDILGVTLGAGSSNAISAARLHLSNKYRIPIA